MAIRATIEAGARKRKQGTQVRGGFVVLSTAFKYDQKKYGTDVEKLGRSTQYTVPVVVKNSRILRTRAKFDEPWSCTFEVDVDDEMIDQSQLLEWFCLSSVGKKKTPGENRPLQAFVILLPRT